MARTESGSIRTKNQWKMVLEQISKMVSRLRWVCHGGLFAEEEVVFVEEVMWAVGSGLDPSVSSGYEDSLESWAVMAVSVP